ncbi:MAG: IS1 family transposase [Leptolyngbyaceae cyanobacterium]
MLSSIQCPSCQSEQVVKQGFDTLKEGASIQRYRGQSCGQRCNEHAAPRMARWRSSSAVGSYASGPSTQQAWM